AVLAPPIEGELASVLALLSDGAAWSTSALALALGASQRTVQRAVAELQATGQVIKAGRRIIVTTAQVVHVAPDGKRSDCAVMQQTIVPVPKTY
ncbi:MAG: hypothetical protein ACLGH2_06040, partial [Gammaproteobacteria bacterium]